MTLVLKQGDTKPDLILTLTDADGQADFGNVTAADCRVLAVMDDAVVVDDVADTITFDAATPSSLTVRRAWAATETDTPGRMWVLVEVTWPDGTKQSFPGAGEVMVEIERA